MLQPWAKVFVGVMQGFLESCRDCIGVIQVCWGVARINWNIKKGLGFLTSSQV